MFRNQYHFVKEASEEISREDLRTAIWRRANPAVKSFDAMSTELVEECHDVIQRALELSKSAGEEGRFAKQLLAKMKLSYSDELERRIQESPEFKEGVEEIKKKHQWLNNA
jgi:hypothetical protein